MRLKEEVVELSRKEDFVRSNQRMSQLASMSNQSQDTIRTHLLLSCFKIGILMKSIMGTDCFLITGMDNY